MFLLLLVIICLNSFVQAGRIFNAKCVVKRKMLRVNINNT